MSNFLYGATEWLSNRLMRKQYVETQLAIARRRDPSLPHRYDISVVAYNALNHKNEPMRCICGDPECELPWQDGGKTQ